MIMKMVNDNDNNYGGDNNNNVDRTHAENT
jgi:hypothetical protein